MKLKRQKSSIFFKMIVMILVPVIITLTIMQAVLLREAGGELNKLSSQQVGDNSLMAAKDTEAFFYKYRMISEQMAANTYVAKAEWNVTGRPWYKVKDLGDTLLVPPYADTSTGKTFFLILWEKTLRHISWENRDFSYFALMAGG